VNVVILGTGDRARTLAERLESAPRGRVSVLGFLDDAPSDLDRVELKERYLGPLTQLRKLVADRAIERAVYALPRRFLAEDSVINLISTCEMLGVEVTIPLDLFETRASHMVPETMAGTPALTLSLRGHHRPWKLAVKRSMDLLLASLLLVVTFPIWIVAMLAIKLDSDGPVFFRQQRSGRLGRPFWFYKFRTMKVNAEASISELRGRNEQTGPVFKIKDDPRVTRVGRWLRRYSIDELPQLMHVIAGDMSLVGPRPPLPAEVLQYEIDHRARLSMRPGITCLWQVSGRNEIAFGDWVKLDLEYIERWSLWLDLEIMLLTIPAVLSGRGAS
jgi:exopolysaccharide biosynthesis polyprenyl glycosylphosphotransferase